MIRHISLLGYLRWKYLWRTGGRSRRIGAALAILVSLGFSAVLFLLSSTILDRLFLRPEEEHAAAWELVHFAFAGVYIFWLYSGSFNDLYDPGRLAPFPLPPRTLFLGSTLSSFIGLSTIFGLALLAGFVAGVPGTPAQKIVRGGLFVLLLVHLQMMSRLIRLLFLALLTSRRWRDAAVLISTLIGGGVYVMWQLLPRESAQTILRALQEFAAAGGPSRWLAWCPGVWLSWAYELEGIRSAAGLGGFAVLTFLIYRAGGWAEERLAFSDPIFQYRPRRAALAAPIRFLKGVPRAALRIAGPAAAAMARKEFAVFFRDPAVRHRVLASVFYILLPFTVLFVVRTPENDRALELGGFFLIFAEMFFLTNLFGIEGASVRNLLWFPASRRHLFLGKNLAYFALFAPFNALVLIVIAFVTGSEQRLPAGLAAHLGSLLVVMALGNVTSVYFPLPFLAPGQRMSRRDESGCLMAVARSLLYLLTFVLLAPVLVVSVLVEGTAWSFAAAPAGLAYAAGLYWIGLRMAERALLEREEALGDYFRAA